MRISGLLLFLLAALAIGPAPAAWAQTQTTAGMVFTPVAPCRAFNGQSLAAGQRKNFLMTGAVDMSSQGGPAGGCGVPAYAKAVSINLSATGSSTPGYLTPYAFGASRPNLVALNYDADAATSGTIVPLGTDGKITVYATSLTKVGGYITGYFEPQLWAAINYLGGVITSSGRINSVSKGGTGVYYVTFDRTLSACAATATSSDAARITSTYAQPSYVTVYVYNTASTLVDANFTIHVTC